MFEHSAHRHARVCGTTGGMVEGRDDTSKLPLGKAGQAYAHMTSADVMQQPGGVAPKVKKRFDLQKEVTNQQGVKGFPSKDAAGKVPHAIKDSTPTQVVAALLED